MAGPDPSPSRCRALWLIGTGLSVKGYLIAADLWPDGEITAASLVIDVLLFVLPGVVLVGVGAVIERGRGTWPPPP